MISGNENALKGEYILAHSLTFCVSLFQNQIHSKKGAVHIAANGSLYEY